ncbi:hypothetical protein ASPSYDRAFT_40184 [Aspergillus sydowii CBS 593.65]|uniref:Enoyl reductase (ER) domain-containing protein n=1 Tax=Aspergillus sydowii CBS 593.65 TaxID=1036612 RepID=A0A1L9U135_9EURO|nr:uncharacterized protein ASPSYDRAFT_40184 [Aspergillus sydowii CBS 593.65]OJJ65369.1 hypothetical protein ASPSYDRAFT_40184 [Aspergillus sydowii CBS 593.65]
MTQNCRGVVSRPPLESGDLDFRLENLSIRDIEDDECLVEIVATGLCHTDLGVASRPDSIFPRVLGHEGAGYLRKIGNKVNRSPMNLQEGDPVLLSIAFCNACPSCRSGHPAYCQSALKLNFAHPGRGTYTMADGKDKNTTVVGGFFGQSSLGSLAIVDTSCIVNLAGTVKSRDELKMFAPLGCGFQTGAGTVMNLGKACPSDSVTIIGIGGVGLAGVMAAKIIGCQKIIAIDRIPDRLTLAKELGATHVIDSSALVGSIEDAVRNVTDGLGSSLTIDTTGNISVIRSAPDMTAILGRVILLGMSKQSIDVDITKFKLSGKVLLGSVQGDVIPSQFIPQMISWHRAGNFPIEKLVRFYKASEIATAVADTKNGTTVKPVILW